MKFLFITLTVFGLTLPVFAQIPTAIGIQILKAEDARRYDSVLEGLMRSPNSAIRTRAALASGRIGDDAAVPALSALLENDRADEVRAMAAFALGETESVKAADAVLKAIKSDISPGHGNGTPTLSLKPANVTARLIEAAGKIAAANPKDESAKALGRAVVEVLDGEAERGFAQDRTTVLLGLTAVLRAKPDGGEVTTAKFLLSKDGRIRTDAGNTLTRLKAKNESANLRDMLENDKEPTARANAARALGAAEDKSAFWLLIKAATTDADSRVRVSAIRAIGSLKDVKASDKLLETGEKLLAIYNKSKFKHPVEQNELIEIASVLGRLLTGSGNARAVKFLGELALLDDGRTAELSVARMRVEPGDFPNTTRKGMTWHEFSTAAQVAAELATIEPKTDEVKKMKAEAPAVLKLVIEAFSEPGAGDDKLSAYAMPDYLQAYAQFKTADLAEVLRASLGQKDVQIRASAAGLLAEQPALKENVEALKTAFSKALLTDKHDDDAQLAILDSLYKLDKKESVGTLLTALNAPDYLVRKKAFGLLADKNLQKDFPGIPTSLKNARSKQKEQVLPYSAVFGTKLGQVLNTEADYRRALSRKNGTVKAVLTTEKGPFTIVFNPEEAPLTVDNWVKLARSGYFNGLEVHRVVPNFVMQDGDPRGDGNGGPGWSIRCEVNLLPYDRGAVGMALSGKDTGGSQWFVTHAPQPHLDGGYTVFGRVNETGMKIVDNIVRGDKIISVRIVGK
ncbi:MAG: peptidylprolyl isomerase [Pyrinomonadaceae bacterium]